MTLALAQAAPAGSTTETPAAPTPRALFEVTQPEKPLALPELLSAAKREHGCSVPGLLTDILRLSLGAGKVSPEEYFDLKLFDRAGLNGDRSAFLGNAGCKAVAKRANPGESWHAVVTNKLVFDTVMGGFGLPTIKTHAFYHKKWNLPALGMLRSTAEVAAFLRQDEARPLFGKPINSSLSLGTLAIDGYDRATDRMRLGGGRTATPEEVAAAITAAFPGGYVFQEQLQPHPAMRALAGPTIGTVRVYTFWEDFRPKVFRAVWKIPAGENRADNFWRGNLLAAFDQQTGVISRVIRGAGMRQQELTAHPDTGAQLVGVAVPEWREVEELAVWAAGLLQEVRLIGWDIAVTDRGPVLVEANNAPDFSLVQMAERRGAGDARMRAFLERTDKMKATYDKNEKTDKKARRSAGLNRAMASLK